MKRLEKLVLFGHKWLDQELARTKRTIDYLRYSMAALQNGAQKSCCLENRLSSTACRLAVLKTIKEFIEKGILAGPFQEL